LANNEHDSYHAVRYGNRPVWGLQFHPEYTADIMRSYLTHQADHLRKTGKNYEQLAQKVEDTPLSASLLKQFARIALGHGTTGDTGNTGDTDDL
jgi:GMP synthase (glutamine-hydrolysing)